MTKKPSQVKSGYLFTFELNPQDKGTKETLILFPGFSTNCLMFLKLFRILCKEYHIVTFDYYGMGLSSREKFQETDRENILDTQLLTIEEWRINNYITQNFSIIGYCYGAYLASHYIATYRPKINTFFMIAPIGFTTYNPESQYHPSASDLKDFYQFVNDAEKSGPQGFLNRGFLKRYFLKNYLTNFRKCLSDKEIELLSEYYQLMTEMDNGWYKSFDFMIQNGCYSNLPIKDVLFNVIDNCKNKINLILGDKDWIDMDEIRNCQNELDINNKVCMSKVEKCGHLQLIENYDELLKKIMGDKYFQNLHGEIYNTAFNTPERQKNIDIFLFENKLGDDRIKIDNKKKNELEIALQRLSLKNHLDSDEDIQSVHDEINTLLEKDKLENFNFEESTDKAERRTSHEDLSKSGDYSQKRRKSSDFTFK